MPFITNKTQCPGAVLRRGDFVILNNTCKLVLENSIPPPNSGKSKLSGSNVSLVGYRRYRY